MEQNYNSNHFLFAVVFPRPPVMVISYNVLLLIDMLSQDCPYNVAYQGRSIPWRASLALTNSGVNIVLYLVVVVVFSWLNYS